MNEADNPRVFAKALSDAFMLGLFYDSGPEPHGANLCRQLKLTGWRGYHATALRHCWTAGRYQRRVVDGNVG